MITGTSSGVGLETSILFAQKGYKVFATMRDLSKKNALLQRVEKEALDVEVMQLDVTSTESVNHCIDSIISQVGRIDILINNAGGGFT